MEFRATYQGPLKANRGPKEKQAIRRVLHPQFRELSKHKPYPARFLDPDPTKEDSALVSVGPFLFAPLINKFVGVGAKLRITMLRPEAPGGFVMQGGDIDNRLKTLLDALSVPQANQIPSDDTPSPDERPLFCLLEDDSLILSLDVTTDRLLTPCQDPSEAFLMIHVETRCIFTNSMVMGIYFT